MAVNQHKTLVLYGRWMPDGCIDLDTSCTVLTCLSGSEDLSSSSTMVPGPAKGFTTITIPGQRMPASDDKLAWDTNDFSLLLLFPEDSVVDTAKGTVTYPAGRGFQLLDSRQVEYHHQQLLIASQP